MIKAHFNNPRRNAIVDSHGGVAAEEHRRALRLHGLVVGRHVDHGLRAERLHLDGANPAAAMSSIF